MLELLKGKGAEVMLEDDPKPVLEPDSRVCVSSDTDDEGKVTVPVVSGKLMLLLENRRDVVDTADVPLLVRVPDAVILVSSILDIDTNDIDV